MSIDEADLDRRLTRARRQAEKELAKSQEKLNQAVADLDRVDRGWKWVYWLLGIGLFFQTVGAICKVVAFFTKGQP